MGFSASPPPPPHHFVLKSVLARKHPMIMWSSHKQFAFLCSGVGRYHKSCRRRCRASCCSTPRDLPSVCCCCSTSYECCCIAPTTIIIIYRRCTTYAVVQLLVISPVLAAVEVSHLTDVLLLKQLVCVRCCLTPRSVPSAFRCCGTSSDHCYIAHTTSIK